VEVAQKRIADTGATLVLGSATPSAESYYRAEKGLYQLHVLDKREKGKPAEVTVVDLREELQNGNKSVFSERLHGLIADRLEKKEQTMLFINRRGYAGFVSCRDCGKAIRCPHCDVTLKLHRNRKLVCHYCGHTEELPGLCPACGSKYLGSFGIGTQQIETLLKKEFPQATILRMDADTTNGKGGHEEILSAFANGKADILVGTQMIVKGHDFPNVTLVGVIAADLSLYESDFRAQERTFQLLCQAVGRAGRGMRPGEAVIQTYAPDNYSIRAAAEQNYKAFYEEEMAFRSLMNYPPMENMVCILLMSENQKELNVATEELLQVIRKIKEEQLEKLMIIGPAQPPVAKIKDIYRNVIYLKDRRRQNLVGIKDYLETVTNGSQNFKNVRIQYDFNI
jgi:primosomal protein N' (replication factor Y)